MKFKFISFIWIFFFGSVSFLYSATNETVVEIHNIDDRMKATVTSPAPEQEVLPPRNLEKPIIAVEETTVGVAGQSTKFVAKSTDAAVGTVQKVGDSFFSKMFKAMDVNRWEKTESNKKGAIDGEGKKKEGKEKSG